MLVSIVCLISGVLALLVIRRHRQGQLLVPLPGPPSPSYIYGHLKNMFGLHGIEFQEEALKTYGPTIRLDGMMGTQFVFTLDPIFIHTVLVKDRLKFERSPGLAALSRSLFGSGLIALIGDEHRQKRKILNPVFTGQHIRQLLPVVTEVTKMACRALDQSLLEDTIDVLQWTTATALELIGEAGLGYSFDALSGAKNEYRMANKNLGQLVLKLLPLVPIYPYLLRLPITRNILSYIPIPMLRRALKNTNTLNEQAKQIIRARKDMLTKGVGLESVTGRGKDILTQLMRTNEGPDEESLVGDMNVFISAGHDTTGSMIARTLDVLSQNSQIQDKLRNEVLESKEEDVLELPYLDAVVKEALRLYPPAAFIGRLQVY